MYKAYERVVAARAEDARIPTARHGLPWILGLILGMAFLLHGCAMPAKTVGKTAHATIKAHKIVKTAYAQMGKKYRAGGASPHDGFDCSGLVWWTYKQHGVNVPRISRDQAKVGKAIAKKSARPGDIVVFRTSNSPNGLHTGLYAGGNSFIHSPGVGKKVRLDDLTLPHWKDKLVAVRRVVP